MRTTVDAGWSSPVARQAHNLKVTGSNPVPATKISPLNQWFSGFFVVQILGPKKVYSGILTCQLSPLDDRYRFQDPVGALSTDLMGTVRLVDAAMPFLLASKAASIVTISSVSAREVDPDTGPYGVFKAAIVHYTQGLAQKLAAKGVRANTVSPGTTYFEGGIWNQIKDGDPALYQMALDLNPTGRMGTPQEMANAAVFLASPAASFISGTNLVVDGALTRGVQL